MNTTKEVDACRAKMKELRSRHLELVLERECMDETIREIKARLDYAHVPTPEDSSSKETRMIRMRDKLSHTLRALTPVNKEILEVENDLQKVGDDLKIALEFS